MESLKAGIIINKLLQANPSLNNKVKGKIFPIISEADVESPFIVYRRTGLNPKYIKGGNIEDDITMEILAISNNYKESVEIAQLVRDTLEYKEVEDTIITLSDASETYGEGDSFIQTIIFKINNL